MDSGFSWNGSIPSMVISGLDSTVRSESVLLWTNAIAMCCIISSPIPTLIDSNLGRVVFILKGRGMGSQSESFKYSWHNVNSRTCVIYWIIPNITRVAIDLDVTRHSDSAGTQCVMSPWYKALGATYSSNRSKRLATHYIIVVQNSSNHHHGLSAVVSTDDCSVRVSSKDLGLVL